jgi:hypothetical protein
MAYQAHKVILVRMPGFTRGLDCIELLAFVELSQVRKSAVFGGIPLVGKLKARTCGIWAAHIATGQPLGFLHLGSEDARDLCRAGARRDAPFRAARVVGRKALLSLTCYRTRRYKRRGVRRGSSG